jgi:hypothetical protein
MQHGGFLAALDDLGEEAIIIFTDTDIEVQRSFTENELDILRNFGDGEIGVNYKRDENFSLQDEVELLDLKIELEELLERYPKISELDIYNTGVIVANRKTYNKLYEAYNLIWPKFKDIFGHYAKQQWLLSYLIQTKFEPNILSCVIHTHGCQHPWELRVDKAIAGHKFCIGSEIVVFKHDIKHESAKIIKSQRRLIKRLAICFAIALLVCLVFIVRDILVMFWNR